MRKIRMGMVGGGQGAFIGAVHRISAQLDNEIELVCGAFSSDAARSKASGEALYLDKTRCYENYKTLFEQEALLNDDQRMDFVAIVTPNHLHYPIAKMAMEYGFHVMSDKPATANLHEALALQKIVDETGMLYGLTHTYTGYPIIKEAKQLVAEEKLGRIKKIVVEYTQGWLASKDDENNKQAAWRLDPNQAGISCCMGDIGVHAANLTEYVSGLEISELCADLSSNVDGRVLDDDGTVLLKFNSGAHGVLMASQISVGDENNLKLRIYGEQASLEWSQLEPNSLHIKYQNKPAELIRVGVGSFSATAQENMRTPAGHPEGYLEAFANIYRQFAQQIRAHWCMAENTESSAIVQDMPGIHEAIRGMAFIENVVYASKQERKWQQFLVTPRF